jgi:hypothetical protein
VTTVFLIPGEKFFKEFLLGCGFEKRRHAQDDTFFASPSC